MVDGAILFLITVSLCVYGFIFAQYYRHTAPSKTKKVAIVRGLFISIILVWIAVAITFRMLYNIAIPYFSTFLLGIVIFGAATILIIEFTSNKHRK